MKKQAIDTIDLKKQELQGTINDALRLLNTKLQEATKELTDKATQEMEKIVVDLSDTIEQKMNEAKSLISQQNQTPASTTAPTQPAQADDIDWKRMLGKTWHQMTEWFGPSEEEMLKRLQKEKSSVSGIRGSTNISLRAKKQKKLSPRDTEDNSELPEFWRRNKDLGESPYLYMDELTKITDEVTQDVIKRRKKRESKKR